MLFRDVKREVEQILWLRNRIRQMRSAIQNQTEFDHSNDFDMLKRKLHQYEFDYFELSDQLYLLLLKL
ncbi:MAG: hypothetical protein WCK11_05515 [Candidatus Falkowbacteria bacterium]